jgi:hypothetical protein
MRTNGFHFCQNEPNFDAPSQSARWVPRKCVFPLSIRHEANAGKMNVIARTLLRVLLAPSFILPALAQQAPRSALARASQLSFGLPY